MSLMNVINLNSTIYPECWTDEETIQQLYAPFRVRSLNSVNYDNKMKFWKEMIHLYCDAKGCSVVTINNLNQDFQIRDRKAYVFTAVLNDMLTNNEAQYKSKFLETPQNSWTGWAMDIALRKPFTWSFNKVKDALMTVDNNNIEFVILQTVKVSLYCLIFSCLS